MNVNEYSYVLAVMECGSISEAAKALYISQPALSMYIRNLENRLGDKLFYKSGGTLHLTDIGMRYCEYAQKIVSLDRALEREIRELKNQESGEVILGVPTTRGEEFLSQVLPVFQEQYPGIQVKIVEGTSAKLETMAYERQIDIAILHYPFKEYSLEYTALTQEEVCLFVPSDFPICEKAQGRPGHDFLWMDMAHLRQEKFILFRKGQRMRQAADTLFQAAGYEPNILWELSSAMSIYRLTCCGMGASIGIGKFYTSHKTKDIQAFSVGEIPLYYNVVAAYASREKLSHSAQAMLQVIQGIYRTDNHQVFL